MALHACTHTLRHHTHSTPVSTNNPTLQHTPHNEGDQAMHDTINDNLENSDFVQCVQNKSYIFTCRTKKLKDTQRVQLNRSPVYTVEN